MTSSYDLSLVATSFLVAVLASFTAIDLTGRVSVARGAARRIWLLCGSVAMGVGIWSMHFIGMLSFHLPVPIRYSVPLWLLSIGIAVAASALALSVVSHRDVTVRGLLLAAPWMGLAIAGMHYTGMAAIRIPAEAHYDPWLVTLSVVIAIVSSFVALWLARHLGTSSGIWGLLGKCGSGVVMGLAICGMHYTGMAAASFHSMPATHLPSEGHLIASQALTVSVVMGTLVILFFALVGASIDRRVRRSMLQSARLQQEQLVRQSEARFRSLVQRSSDVVLILEPDSSIRFASPAVERVFGYSPDGILASRLMELLHDEDRDGARRYFTDAVASTDDLPSIVWRLRHRDGSWRHVDVAGANLSDEETVGGIVLNIRDITERVSLEAELMHQAFHDSLTGLANRALFRDRVEHSLTREGRRNAGIAVMFLDLDDFKTINDSLGHAAGDRLLRSVAARLLNATRGCDTVARLGGDEFGVSLENVRGVDDAVVVAERILGAMQTPFVLDGKEVRVSLSLGVAQAADGDGVEELLRNADLAMYGAKHGGKARYELFAPQMHAEVLDRLELEADLRSAVEKIDRGESEFRLVYQPIVQLATERITGVEALVRWDHPRRGTVNPAIFVPLAEEMGLIRSLGSWILREACREVASWGEGTPPESVPAAEWEHVPLPTVSINLSGRQLQHPDLVEEVAAILRETGLAPDRVVFEITETVIMKDTEEVLASLRQLKALGIRLAIDDFGTGYSSLSYLQKFPVDILKIDKAFVDGVAAGGQAAALTRTIIALADTLSLRTVAEGIEGNDQCLHLQALGCSFGQGYLFAKPLSSEAAGALVRAGLGVSA